MRALASALAAEPFTLLIIAERPEIIAALHAALPRSWRCLAAVNRRMARHVLDDVARPDLMLIDANLPDGDGFRLFSEQTADERLADIPVIMVADSADSRHAAYLPEWRRQAFAMGATDFIIWPCDAHELRARVANPLAARLMQRRLAAAEQRQGEWIRIQMAQATAALADTLAFLARAATKLPGAGDSTRIERLTVSCHLLATRLSGISAFRTELTPDWLAAFCQAVPLHDIGWCARSNMGGLPMQEPHTTAGARLMADARRMHPDSLFLAMACDMAQSHHENWDGSGQPHGLAKADIPLPARILRLADAYDALLSGRSGQPSMNHGQAMAVLAADGGRRFDPRILDCFLFYERDFAAFASEYHLQVTPERSGPSAENKQKQAPGPYMDRAPAEPPNDGCRVTMDDDVPGDCLAGNWGVRPGAAS